MGQFQVDLLLVMGPFELFSARSLFLPVSYMETRAGYLKTMHDSVIRSDFLLAFFLFFSFLQSVRCVSDGILFVFQVRLAHRERSGASVTTAWEKLEFVCHDVCSATADPIAPTAATKILTIVVSLFIIVYFSLSLFSACPVYRSAVAIGIIYKKNTIDATISSREDIVFLLGS